MCTFLAICSPIKVPNEYQIDESHVHFACVSRVTSFSILAMKLKENPNKTILAMQAIQTDKLRTKNGDL